MLSINLYSLILGVFLLYKITSGEIFPECSNVNIGNYTVDPNNCMKYIFCSGNDSYSEFCDLNVPYFTEQYSCSDSIAVCGNRPIPITPAPATTLDPVTALNTTTPTVDPTTTTTVASTTTTITNTANPNMVICPNTDDSTNPIFISNNKSCSDYYLCYHGQPVAMQCANMLHFDMKQQKCDKAEHVQCQLDIVTPREQCQPHTVDVYPHPHNCNYYYLCEMGYLMIMQCPFNEGWDYEKRVCVLLPKAKCYNSLPREEY